MTIVYLVRHSEKFKIHRGIEDVHEDVLFSNIKTPLSVMGEKLAEKVSKNKEFFDLDVVWSSNYVRAMSTAKYFAYNNNLKVNVSDKLGERVHGVDSWDDLPEDFEIRQFNDENYKIGYGESRKEATDRIFSFINKLLEENNGKKILLVGHSTAFMFYLMKWCNINYDGEYKFNGNVFFDGKWGFCEAFKLEFDDHNELINICKINREN